MMFKFFKMLKKVLNMPRKTTCNFWNIPKFVETSYGYIESENIFKGEIMHQK